MSKNVQTPWGIAQKVRRFVEGIYFYETASHGGYYIQAAYNDLIPKDLRIEGGWYNKDDGAAIVEYFLFELIQGKGFCGHSKEMIKSQIVADFDFSLYEQSIKAKMEQLSASLEWDAENSYHAKEFMSINSHQERLEQFRKQYLNNNLDEWSFEQFFRRVLFL